MQQILIVGAGPAGLGLACALLQHGIPVRVVDKASGPATTSRANFLHARGSEVLDRLDALGDLPQRSVRAMQITTYLGEKPLMRLRFGDPGMQTAAPPMVISQAEVEATLRNRLAALGGAVEWGMPLVDLRQDESAVVATVGDTQMQAAWLVGCDGAGSTTRRLAGIGFPRVKLSERFLLADVALDWDMDRSGTTGWIHPSGLIGVMPMPGGLWRVFAYDPGQSSEKPAEPEILARVQQILPQRTGRDVHVLEAEWLSMFTVHRGLADAYRRGRVLIAGDAGHIHAPFGGQGMLTGLGDVENLAWKLALVVDDRANTTLLDTYEAERRPLATEVLRGTSAVTRVNVAQGRLVRFIRDRIAPPIFSIPALQRLVTYQASQLWVSYKRGPLGESSRWKAKLRVKPSPGDRVADQECFRLDGVATRLYVELRGRWALLGADESLAGTARTHLGHRITLLRSVDRDTWLVRPDGHLAWRGHDPVALERWLRTALGNGTVR
ncbi:MAG: FAD-dependent monooxygenase [Mycobacteriaceae bacterium]|nr:FAD-dependent monooxygenase [Mycobacteriaceae bacterium]